MILDYRNSNALSGWPFVDGTGVPCRLGIQAVDFPDDLFRDFVLIDLQARPIDPSATYAIRRVSQGSIAIAVGYNTFSFDLTYQGEGNLCHGRLDNQMSVRFIPGKAIAGLEDQAFNFSNGIIVPSAVRRVTQIVTRFSVDDGATWVDADGLTFEAGYNLNISRTKNGAVLLDVYSGAGKGRYDECEAFANTVRRINGVNGGDRGNVSLTGTECYSLTYPAPNAVMLANNCKPACTPDQYTAVGHYMNRVASAMRQTADQGRVVVDAMNNLATNYASAGGLMRTRCEPWLDYSVQIALNRPHASVWRINSWSGYGEIKYRSFWVSVTAHNPTKHDIICQLRFINAGSCSNPADFMFGAFNSFGNATVGVSQEATPPPPNPDGTPSDKPPKITTNPFCTANPGGAFFFDILGCFDDTPTATYASKLLGAPFVVKARTSAGVSFQPAVYWFNDPLSPPDFLTNENYCPNHEMFGNNPGGVVDIEFNYGINGTTCTGACDQKLTCTTPELAPRGLVIDYNLGLSGTADRMDDVFVKYTPGGGDFILYDVPIPAKGSVPACHRRGIMVRESMAPDAPFWAILVTDEPDWLAILVREKEGQTVASRRIARPAGLSQVTVLHCGDIFFVYYDGDRLLAAFSTPDSDAFLLCMDGWGEAAVFGGPTKYYAQALDLRQSSLPPRV